MRNSKAFKVGSKIQWKWLGRKIDGEIVEVHLQSVSKLIKEKAIKRKGSAENPAYLVKSAAGNLALKLHSELEPLQIEEHSLSKPKMFKYPAKVGKIL